MQESLVVFVDVIKCVRSIGWMLGSANGRWRAVPTLMTILKDYILCIINVDSTKKDWGRTHPS